MIRPPASIAFLVEASDQEAALLFIEGQGGGRIKIPARPVGSYLAALYGDAIATALSEHHGGELFKVPMCRQWRAQLYRARGLTVTQIGRHLGASRSAVQRLLAGTDRDMSAEASTRQRGPPTYRNDPAQIDLFEET